MSSKKSLLTESEVRRFMKLAGVPSLNEMGPAPGYHVTQAGHRDGQAGSSADPLQEYGMTEEDPMPEEDEESMEMDPEELGAGAEGGEGKEEIVSQILDLLDELAPGIIQREEGGGSEEASMEEPGEEMTGSEEEESEEESEEEGEEDSEEQEEVEEAMYSEEEEEKKEGLHESKVVDAVLARVTARLISEAKKKKMQEKKKKMTPAEKMKAMKAAKDKKKKLEEANAAAPKATNSNGPKKGAGSATKGTFGVTSKVQDQKWDKKGKGDHEMETVSASSEHMTSHGSKNLATMGGNKKK